VILAELPGVKAASRPIWKMAAVSRFGFVRTRRGDASEVAWDTRLILPRIANVNDYLPFEDAAMIRESQSCDKEGKDQPKHS
jgi:hypothetical protein